MITKCAISVPMFVFKSRDTRYVASCNYYAIHLSIIIAKLSEIVSDFVQVWRSLTSSYSLSRDIKKDIAVKKFKKMKVTFHSQKTMRLEEISTYHHTAYKKRYDFLLFYFSTASTIFEEKCWTLNPRAHIPPPQKKKKKREREKCSFFLVS